MAEEESIDNGREGFSNGWSGCHPTRFRTGKQRDERNTTSGGHQHVLDAQLHFKEVLPIGGAQRPSEVCQFRSRALSEYVSFVLDVCAVSVLGDASLGHWDDALDEAFHFLITDALRDGFYARPRGQHDAL